MVVRIWLTGSLCFESLGVLVESRRFPGRQGRVAFAYLVGEHDRAVTRGALIELLWPELPPRAYDVALSAVMSKLRALMSSAGLGRLALETVASGYRLNLPAAAWIDVDAAAEAVHEAEAGLRAGAGCWSAGAASRPSRSSPPSSPTGTWPDSSATTARTASPSRSDPSPSTAS